MSYFIDITSINLLPMTNGKALFFRQLGSWFQEYDSAQSDSRAVSYILPNPAQGLSFPTGADVLSTILMMSMDVSNIDDEVISLLLEFGLEPAKGNQPIVSLSGGELLLLNYAKAKAMLPTVHGLVACSPVHWLNESRYKFWDSLVTNYSANSKHIDVALLSGEPFPHIMDKEDISIEQQIDRKSLEWRLLTTTNITVLFQEIQFPSYNPESRLHFCTESTSLSLQSPTLITGDNGIGKSILAKLMAGIIKPIVGEISSLSQNGKGNARLIFQDSIDQIFGMSVDHHIDWVFRFDSARGKVAKSIYSDMEKSLRESLHKYYFSGLSALGTANTRDTLLQAKLCLVAERIASLPPLIVLDEPGWGLSKTVSQYFLGEVCKHAHSNGVAIAIISHQPTWWKGFIQSHIELIEHNNDGVKIVTREVAL
jgi:energy-coupling factor transporter ATP-binding protein EcfA2